MGNHPQVCAGELVWQFDFHWKRTGAEKANRLFIQLGKAGLMSTASQDSGIGINLVWTAINSEHETLGYRRGGVDTSLATVSGPATILVTAKLDTHTYQVSGKGTLVRSDLPFDNNVNLDTLRYFTDGLNEVYFSELDPALTGRWSGKPGQALHDLLALARCPK